MNIRIIPRLDIKGPNKGINFEGLRVLGKPQQFARHYYQHGADELFYIDAVASLYGRNSLLEIVEATATVPRAGADKVSLNTAALARPELVREAALCCGSSTILISIEAIRMSGGSYEAFAGYGRESIGPRYPQQDEFDHSF